MGDARSIRRSRFAMAGAAALILAAAAALAAIQGGPPGPANDPARED